MELRIRDWTVIGTPAEILEIIRLSEADEPKEEPQEKPKPNRKKDFDIGKARALRDAGWSYDKIGSEMHVSGVTVAKHLGRGAQDELEEAEE